MHLDLKNKLLLLCILTLGTKKTYDVSGKKKEKKKKKYGKGALQKQLSQPDRTS